MNVGSHTDDVVLSSRARAMRNLARHKFPTTATSEELIEVMQEIIAAAKQADPDIQLYKSLSRREREEFIGKRLISPNFQWTLPGRAVLVSRDQQLSVMINEEDHLRVQILSQGLEIESAADRLHKFLRFLPLDFAQDQERGYLASSVFNAGPGVRYSVMLHLVGMGFHQSKIELLEALLHSGITIRGIFGEGSRPVGAFAQVSTTQSSIRELIGASDYLIDRERQARNEIGASVLESKAGQALLFLRSSPKITLPDAFRVLGWLRWAASAKLAGFPNDLQRIDTSLATLHTFAHESQEHADGQRADGLRKALGV